MKGPIKDLLIALVCGYFVYVEVKMLLEVPFGDWAMKEYLLALIALGLTILGVLRVKDFVVKSRQKPEEEAEGGEEEKPAEQAPPPPEEPKAEQEEDLSYLDDLSDLEGVELLEIKTVIPDTLEDDEDEDSQPE